MPGHGTNGTHRQTGTRDTHGAHGRARAHGSHRQTSQPSQPYNPPTHSPHVSATAERPRPTQQPQARSRPLPAANCSEEAAPPSEPDPASTRSQSASPRLWPAPSTVEGGRRNEGARGRRVADILRIWSTTCARLGPLLPAPMLRSGVFAILSKPQPYQYMFQSPATTRLQSTSIRIADGPGSANAHPTNLIFAHIPPASALASASLFLVS